ncbi:MAG: metal-sensitive transcriptional regulator [Dehalococcoidia bacterium]
MQAEKDAALKRLAYIEGHLKGIRRMVEEDQYCVDILKQTHAVKRAIDKFDQLLLQGHLAGCVPTGFQEGRGEQVVKELNDLFELARRS